MVSLLYNFCCFHVTELPNLNIFEFETLKPVNYIRVYPNIHHCYLETQPLHLSQSWGATARCLSLPITASWFCIVAAWFLRVLNTTFDAMFNATAPIDHSPCFSGMHCGLVCATTYCCIWKYRCLFLIIWMILCKCKILYDLIHVIQ